MTPDQLKDRSQKFSIDIIRFAKTISADFIDRELLRQLVRAAASASANYRAACRARSKAEFFAKLSIVVEESDEVLFWLEVIDKAGISQDKQLKYFLKEGLELLKIFVSSRKSAGNNR